MTVLTELRKRAHIAANPAIPANLEYPPVVDSQESQNSQKCAPEIVLTTGAPAPPATVLLRAHLLTLANGLGIKRNWLDDWMPVSGLARLATNPADLLDDYLHALENIATRHAGRVPLDDSAPIHCQHCGPVFVHPVIAAVLPVVKSWPRALGCPWCAVRKAGRHVPSASPGRPPYPNDQG